MKKLTFKQHITSFFCWWLPIMAVGQWISDSYLAGGLAILLAVACDGFYREFLHGKEGKKHEDNLVAEAILIQLCDERGLWCSSTSQSGRHVVRVGRSGRDAHITQSDVTLKEARKAVIWDLLR